MATSTPNFSRALFPKDQQKKFLKLAKENLDIKWIDFEEMLEQETGYSAGSLRNWRAETCGMPLDALNFIVEKSGILMPGNIKLREYKWGSKLGGRNFVRKYGKNRMSLMAEKGRRATEIKYGKNVWKEFASLGGRKAFSTKSGIFSPKNMEKRAIPTLKIDINFFRLISCISKKYCI